MSHHEQLIMWLNNAHAMEQALARVLQEHADDTRDYPEIRQRIQNHAVETERHAERVRDCLEILGTTPSTVKTMIGNISGLVQSASTGMFRDELVKNALMDYAAEHFEIACYRSLIAAAEETEQDDIAEICRDILREEEAMAAWLAHEIPEITRLTLQAQVSAS